MSPETLLILIAPNVSRRMGGEAIKALQIFEQVSRLHANTVQITHARNRVEISELGIPDVEFIDDDAVAVLLWRSRLFAHWLDAWFSALAVRKAERIARRRGAASVVIWQTEPNSPVVPRSVSRRHVNIFGPVNGNIYFPPAFRDAETPGYRARRLMHLPLQQLNRLLPGGLKRADQILVAGGERSRLSLRAAGCPDAVLRDSLDCGVTDDLLDRPPIRHVGPNPRFLHFGRLVIQKGTALIIRSLAKTRLPVRLDIVGSGMELQRCRELVTELRLEDRVVFRGWAAQAELFASFADYRGFVLPSLEDSNGIAVQESMALGLPPICLDWGGPGLLIDNGRTGLLVAPRSLDEITTDLAAAMDRLASDGALADRMAQAARAAAQAWRWSGVAARWLNEMPSERATVAARARVAAS